jgi:hypothetical protein
MPIKHLFLSDNSELRNTRNNCLLIGYGIYYTIVVLDGLVVIVLAIGPRVRG